MEVLPCRTPPHNSHQRSVGWLGEYDALFLQRNNADPLVRVPWRVWARIVERMSQSGQRT